MADLSSSQQGEAIKHALEVRSALAHGDYQTLFRLYHDAPNLSGYLMDQFIERERVKTLQKLCKAFRPTVPLEYAVKNLGFVAADASKSDLKRQLENGRAWIESHLAVIVDGQIDCKATYQLMSTKVHEIESKSVDIKGQIH